MRLWAVCAAVAAALQVLLFMPSLGGGAPLTIVHTNDLHSHLLGFGPNRDYTPESPRDDETVGGFARVAAVIQQVRAARGEGVLVVDAGDFLMGTLFHTVSREEGGELYLLGAAGYDVVTLGNHEFDLNPQGLAEILRAAVSHGRVPAIVAANVTFDDKDSRDDGLQAVFQETGVRPYHVIKCGGVKVGVFGLMGRQAAEVAPFARPVRFTDPLAAARAMVSKLRDEEKVDLVVCLSHSGLSGSKGEDVELAREVPGIHVIVSGHTHTRLEEPLRVGETLIVQAGDYGRYVGVMDLDVESGGCRLSRYQLVSVDDRIPGDLGMQGQVSSLQSRVEAQFLRPRGLSFQQILAEVDFPISSVRGGESNLGDLVADSIRWAIDRYEAREGEPHSRTRVAVESNGLLRDSILPGKARLLAVADLFRAFPLGFGPDGEMGYPLLSVYLNAAEIRKALEVLTTVAPLKGDDYVLQISGLRFTYNPRRIPFDRVVDVWIQEQDDRYVPLDTSSANLALYKVGANLYNATFLKIIGGFTHGLVTIVPKDRQGRPIEDLRQALVDRDPTVPGVQELKEWEGLLDYVRHFPDRDGNGLSEIPTSYREPQGRILPQATWNPCKWLRHATWITWTVLGLAVGVIALLLALSWAGWRLIRRRYGRMP